MQAFYLGFRLGFGNVGGISIMNSFTSGTIGEQRVKAIDAAR